MDITIMRMC